jgi:hypothetical protein
MLTICRVNIPRPQGQRSAPTQSQQRVKVLYFNHFPKFQLIGVSQFSIRFYLSIRQFCISRGIWNVSWFIWISIFCKFPSTFVLILF